MRAATEPSVIAAGSDLVIRLKQLDANLSERADAMAGRETCFIGQIHAGEIYNQFPQECRLEGTRRWLPGVAPAAVEREFRDVLDGLAGDRKVTVDLEWLAVRDAFKLDTADPLVTIFQEAHAAVSGAPLPHGAKAFVDDGNCFWGRKNLPAITHGPRGSGAHTVNEWVEIDDLVRVAQVYALTAARYCCA
jgi:acetylornithine deacetylase/succinyl-diaminopimelate desuccinylase-like protein